MVAAAPDPQGTESRGAAVDALRWAVAEVAVDGLETVDAVFARLIEEVEGLRGRAGNRPLVCRIHLTGRTPLYHELVESAGDGLLSELRESFRTDPDPFVFVESVKLSCRPEANLEECLASEDILGEALRVARDAKQDTELARRLREALAPLFEHRRAKRILDASAEAQLAEVLENSAMLCYDLLSGDTT